MPGNWSDARRHYLMLTAIRPEPQAAKRALYTWIAAQSWAVSRDGKTLSTEAIQKRLARHTGTRLRKRRPELHVQRKHAALIEVLSGPLASHRCDTHDKGAGEYSLGSLRTVLKGVLSNQAIQVALKNHPDILGATPCLSTLEKILRERRGGVDRLKEHRSHDLLERCVGFRAEYAGQVSLVDATGWPVRFRQHDYEKKQKRWLFVHADVASAQVRCANLAATSESEGWRPKDDRQDVMLEFLRGMDYFPEWLINDAISTLTVGLRSLHPGVHPSEILSDGVIAWLLGGTTPYVGLGMRPTSHAHAEVAVKCFKEHVVKRGTSRAIAAEMSGAGLTKISDAENELEFLEMLNTALCDLNAGKLHRRGCPKSRQELWDLESAVASRALRAQATDLFQPAENGHLKIKNLIRATRVGQIVRGRVSVRLADKAWCAEMVVPDGGWQFKAEEKYALILPPGARANDDPEMFRVLVIENDGARVQYHSHTAKSVAVDEYWQDSAAPVVGQFKGLPHNQADEFAKNRDRDKRNYRKSIRQGTTDEILPATDSW